MNITMLLLVLSTIGLLFLHFIMKNNEKRRENLNIVKEGNRLHFFLSDDHFLSIKLEDEAILTNNITRNISHSIKNINGNIRKVSFVNFRNELLKDKLYSILELEKV